MGAATCQHVICLHASAPCIMFCALFSPGLLWCAHACLLSFPWPSIVRGRLTHWEELLKQGRSEGALVPYFRQFCVVRSVCIGVSSLGRYSLSLALLALMLQCSDGSPSAPLDCCSTPSFVMSSCIEWAETGIKGCVGQNKGVGTGQFFLPSSAKLACRNLRAYIRNCSSRWFCT